MGLSGKVYRMLFRIFREAMNFSIAFCLTVLSLCGSVIFSQQGRHKDSQGILQTQEKQETDEKSGYGNYEVDSLHQSIQMILPKIKKKIEKDEKGNYRIMLPVASGETIKSIGERYIYNGFVYLYCNSSAEKLEKVSFHFERINLFGNRYKGEKRILTNPTPFFSDNYDTLDRNEDIHIAYYEDTSLVAQNFQKQSEITLKEIPYYSKKISILQTYLKYTRKTLKKLEKKINAYELSDRVAIEHMLQLK